MYSYIIIIPYRKREAQLELYIKKHYSKILYYVPYIQIVLQEIRDNNRFLRYDFNWLNWYYHFPKPETYKKYEGKLPDKFIMVHFLPRLDSFHKLDQEYSINLIKT